MIEISAGLGALSGSEDFASISSISLDVRLGNVQLLVTPGVMFLACEANGRAIGAGRGTAAS